MCKHLFENIVINLAYRFLKIITCVGIQLYITVSYISTYIQLQYSYTVTLYVYDKLNSDVPGQNGIWAKFNISDLKMMMKSGLGKIFLKFLHAGNYFSLLYRCLPKTTNSVSTKQIPPAWRDFKNIFF